MWLLQGIHFSLDEFTGVIAKLHFLSKLFQSSWLQKPNATSSVSTIPLQSADWRAAPGNTTLSERIRIWLWGYMCVPGIYLCTCACTDIVMESKNRGCFKKVDPIWSHNTRCLGSIFLKHPLTAENRAYAIKYNNNNNNNYLSLLAHFKFWISEIKLILLSWQDSFMAHYCEINYDLGKPVLLT